MVPVQVGNRIAYLVDASRADSMSQGINVRVIRSRRTKAIVRLIISPRELADGCVNEPSSSQDSRKSTKVEYLFCEQDAAAKGVAGSRTVVGHKPSHLYKPSFTHSKGSGCRQEGKRGVPTTTVIHPPVPEK